MAPHSRVFEVTAQQAWDGRRGEEKHLVAAVVAACEAGLARMAWDVGLNGYTVAGLEMGDRRVCREDLGGGLVAEDVRVFDDHGADATLEIRCEVSSIV